MERILTAPFWILFASILVIGTLFGIVLLRHNDKRWHEILSRWIREHGYQLISADYRVLRLGPFAWTSTRGHAVFFITVAQPDGIHRRGWVRLSDPFGGPVDGKVEVSWET